MNTLPPQNKQNTISQYSTELVTNSESKKNLKTQVNDLFNKYTKRNSINALFYKNSSLSPIVFDKILAKLSNDWDPNEIVVCKRQSQKIVGVAFFQETPRISIVDLIATPDCDTNVVNQTLIKDRLLNEIRNRSIENSQPLIQAWANKGDEPYFKTHSFFPVERTQNEDRQEVLMTTSKRKFEKEFPKPLPTANELQKKWDERDLKRKKQKKETDQLKNSMKEFLNPR